MAAVVRIKRRRNDFQPQLIELTCKKQKLENENIVDDSLINIFKFAGTIDSKDQKPLQVVKQAIGREKLKKEYLKCQFEPIAHSRSINKQFALDSRYKIISQKRATNFDKLEIDCLPDEITNAKYQLIDLETENEDISSACFNDDDITCNGELLTKTMNDDSTNDNDKYVYDLFYTNNKLLDYPALENILKIEAYREEELYMGYGENDDDDMLAYDEEDDENEENNWRNDYPDEDPRYYDSMDENQDYGDDEDVGYGFDGEGRAGLAANNDLSDYIDESTDHRLMDTLLVRGMTTTFKNFYR